MHTFYVTAGQLDKEDARHASRVLRLKAGDEITALSEGARYRARIAQLSDKAGAVELLEELPANESPLSITLYQGLPKAEKLEFLAQKLTELGVARLTPVRMARRGICAVQMPLRAEKACLHHTLCHKYSTASKTRPRLPFCRCFLLFCEKMRRKG